MTYQRSCVKTSDYDPGWCVIGTTSEGDPIKEKCQSSQGWYENYNSTLSQSKMLKFSTKEISNQITQ